MFLQASWQFDGLLYKQHCKNLIFIGIPLSAPLLLETNTVPSAKLVFVNKFWIALKEGTQKRNENSRLGLTKSNHDH